MTARRVSTFAYGGDPQVRAIDCPECGQTVRVDRRGSRVSFRCDAQCSSSEEIAAAVAAQVLLPDLAAASANGQQAATDLAESFIRVGDRRLNLPPEPDWVWEGYVGRGMVTVVPGKPKSGKSTLVCGLAAALVSGADQFLGRRVATGSVVYVSEEAAVTIAPKLPDDVLLLDREAAWPRPSWAELVQAAVAVAARENACLLVIDTFPYWASFEPDKEKDAGAVTEAMAQLVGAVRHGMALVLVHHPTQGRRRRT